MHTTSQGPQTDPAALASLVEKCAKLCSNAETAIQNIHDDDGAFLAHNLEGALQQLELILRVIGQDSGEDGSRDSDRQGFLSRLFARETGTNDKDTEPRPAMPPSFDVSKQGLFGNSWTVGLAELLGFLAFGHKTGVLWVDSQTENFIVQLIDGKLVHATSDHTPEGLRLGEILVGLGYLTRRQLERFLVKNEGESVSGEELLESGMISDDELQHALTHQVKQLFLRLVRTQKAVFRFSEGMQIELAHTVDLDVNRLLIDSAKEFDEAGSSAQRAAGVLQEWNAWQQSLANTAAHSLERQAMQVKQATDETAPATDTSKTPTTSASQTQVDADTKKTPDTTQPSGTTQTTGTTQTNGTTPTNGTKQSTDTKSTTVTDKSTGGTRTESTSKESNPQKAKS